MTKKDFELIARSMLTARGLAELPAERAALDTASRVLADALADTNPRFDRTRFLAACGVSEVQS